MPLPLPILDDKTFESLVTEATKMIPRQAPEWSNHNRHDPGITLIELFAWLTEMQQYYLNRIGERNYLKFLDLLGASPQSAAPARGQVTFSMRKEADPLPAYVVVPAGTPLATAEGLIFETAEPLRVVRSELKQILTLAPASAQNNTDANAIDGLSYFLFGETAQAGSALYLGFSQAFPPGEGVDLAFVLFDDYPVPRGSHADERPDITPSATVEWEYRGAGGWTPLEVHDDTVMLSQSGRVSFSGPADMVAHVVHPVTEGLYWVRARLTQDGYELPPRADAILLNTVDVVQTDTFSQVHSFVSSGQPAQSISVCSYLALSGMRILQVRDGANWRDWEEVASLADSGPDGWHYTAAVDSGAGRLTLFFGDGELGALPPAGTDTIRLICYRPELASQLALGPSNGLPGQTFDLGLLPVAAGRLALQVRRIVKPTTAPRSMIEFPPDPPMIQVVWQDWLPVADLDASGPSDPHFLLDEVTGKLRFGDGINGDVPPVPAHGEKNIRVIAYATSAAEKGNVVAGSIQRIGTPAAGGNGLAVTNRRPMGGGRLPETVAEAQTRARAALRTADRAVTGEDFESLARATPGLRVARAKAIPLFSPGLANYPTQQAPAAVTVVVVPYSTAAQPTPSDGFLQTVCRHLDRHRLLTTQLYVVRPEYVAVSVRATVGLQAGAARAEASARIEAALQTFLHPLTGGPAGDGWPFGRPVYRSEIYQCIENVAGVDCVARLALDATGAGTTRDVEGNIFIPPYSLVTSGDLRIDLLPPGQRCRPESRSTTAVRKGELP